MQLAYVNFWVDDVYTSIPRTFTILQACSAAGVEVPRFCYHEKLSIAGNCRMCLVEVNNSKKLVASCAVPVSDNLKVYTNNLRVKKARESVLEFLLANHPLDCPICDQGGECDLQDITISFGSDRGRFYEIEKRAVEDKYCGPLIKTVMTRCIHCTRCIRFISEVSGYPDFGTTGRGVRMEVGSYVAKALSDELSANIIDLCPVGALTSKPYSFTSRPWELSNVESVDIFDVLCSNTRLSVYGNKVKRVLPRINEQLNEDWLTNKARYTYDSFDVQRLSMPLLNLSSMIHTLFNLELSSRLNRVWITVSWKEVLLVFTSLLNKYSLSTSFGPFLDLETLWSYKSFFSLMGLLTFSGISFDWSLFYFSNVRAKEIELYSSFLSINSFLRTEIPLLNTRVRKSYNYYLSSFKFYAVGVGSIYFTYPVKTFSNNKLTLMSFLAGKSYFSRSLASMKNKIVVFYNGLNYTFFTSLFRSIFNPIFVNIHSSITSLSLKHLGISKQVSNSLVYSIGLDTNLFLDSLVYQGSHGSNAALNATLVLPTMIYAEKSSTYLNLEGLLQKAHAGLSPDRLVKKDWEIFAAMFEFQKSYVTDFVGLNMSEFGVLVNSSNAWKEFSLKIPYWVGNNSIYVTSVSQKLILKSSIFLVRILNYYWNDIFSVNSKTMANCAKYIINKNYNYN